MHPILISLPLYVFAALFGAVLGATACGDNASFKRCALYAVLGALLAGGIAFVLPAAQGGMPLHSYGVLILVGFALGVWMAARRAPQAGIAPRHVVDLSLLGVLFGLAGARLMHIGMYWESFNPFASGSFDASRIWKMFQIWNGGLVFFGTFLVIIPFAYFYCRRHALPGLRFLDLAIPSVAAGQAFGRVGCFMNGCCYGKPVALPWAVQFPPDSPPYAFQLGENMIPPGALCSLPVHPTQIYAAVSAALISVFLYALWPRRPYDGFIFALALIMMGTTRFFEELLRTDEPALISAVPFMTIAHWIAAGLILTGAVLLLIFRRVRRAPL